MTKHGICQLIRPHTTNEIKLDLPINDSSALYSHDVDVDVGPPTNKDETHL